MTQHNRVTEQLQELKLPGMLLAFEDQEQVPNNGDLTFAERLLLLLDRERLYRENHRLARLLKRSRLRATATVEDLDFRGGRGLQRATVLALATGEWVQRAQNLIITGPTGAGKTYLAGALLTAVCRAGFTGRYYRLAQLLYALKLAHADGTYGRFLQQTQKFALLVIDDWGIPNLTGADREHLLEVLDDRAGTRSTLIAAQLPIEKWHAYIGDQTLADAICDRMIHGAHRLVLTGESMRKLRAPKLTENEEPAPTAGSRRKKAGQGCD